MSRLRPLALAIALAGFTCAGLFAEVKIIERANGSTYVYNERPPGSSSTRRVSTAVSIQATPITGSVVDGLVERHANAASLELKLVRAVIQAESAFNPRARSGKGAMGLMQLMPATASLYGVSDPYDPEQNVRAGTKYLRRMIDSFGSVELGLAAYNAGPTAVERFRGVPPYPETQKYVEKIMKIYKGDASYSLSGSPHLRRGRKTYLHRDASGRLIMTTTPPAGS